MKPRPVFESFTTHLSVQAGKPLIYQFKAALPSNINSNNISCSTSKGAVQYFLASDNTVNASIHPSTGLLTIPAVNATAFGQLLRVYAVAAGSGPSIAEVYLVQAEADVTRDALAAGAIGGIVAAGAVALLAAAGIAVLYHRRRGRSAHGGAASVVKESAPPATSSDGDDGLSTPEGKFEQANPMALAAAAAAAASS